MFKPFWINSFVLVFRTTVHPHKKWCVRALSIHKININNNKVTLVYWSKTRDILTFFCLLYFDACCFSRARNIRFGQHHSMACTHTVWTHLAIKDSVTIRNNHQWFLLLRLPLFGDPLEWERDGWGINVLRSLGVCRASCGVFAQFMFAVLINKFLIYSSSTTACWGWFISFARALTISAKTKSEPLC